MSDDAHVRRSAVVRSLGWVALAAAVAFGITLKDGPSGEWTTVYLIERSLSLDNVFLIPPSRLRSTRSPRPFAT